MRQQSITAREIATQLGLSVRRVYDLWAQYLVAVGGRQQHRWRPGGSGGAHRRAWPAEVQTLLRKLLRATPPASYSFAASEVHRRFAWKIDRASVRRWAIRQRLGPLQRPRTQSKAVRRWQTQQVGQLWQYDASPHRWFGEAQPLCSMLELIDDHRRVLPGVRLYPRETLLAHLEFLGATFRAVGLPLCLYVDYHSFFFTSLPEALTQLGAALRFYEVSLDYAPTPQAKGKIERAHHFWQQRLPALFAAEGITEIAPANPWIEQLRHHHNRHEHHREIGMKPQAAWNLARRQGRYVLRVAPPCPWWPYVFRVRTKACVGSDRRIAVGLQRLRIERAPGSKVVRCQHPNGDISVLQHGPAHGKRPEVLLHCPAVRSSAGLTAQKVQV